MSPTSYQLLHPASREKVYLGGWAGFVNLLFPEEEKKFLCRDCALGYDGAGRQSVYNAEQIP